MATVKLSDLRQEAADRRTNTVRAADRYSRLRVPLGAGLLDLLRARGVSDDRALELSSGIQDRVAELDRVYSEAAKNLAALISYLDRVETELRKAGRDTEKFVID
jgi:hypothetical protein